MHRLLFVVLLGLAGIGHLAGQPGTIDPTFNPGDLGFGNGDGPSNTVRAIAVQPDGKVLIAGVFTDYNGIERYHIARLNTDGALDASFDPGAGADDIIWSIALQPDGKILVGGDFTSYDGTGRNRMARLNADGSLDTSFDPGTGAGNSVLTTALQADGKVVIGGVFTAFQGIARNRIARLNADGSLDPSFDPGAGANNIVLSLALQPDGKVVAGGLFTSYDGTARSRIARLNTDGSLDATFNPGSGANNSVYTTVVQPDGKLLVGGNFTTYNGTARARIARMNADGSLDLSFDPGSGADEQIEAATQQPDGRILIAGRFTQYQGAAFGRIARLNADGSPDATFDPGAAAAGLADGINAVVLQPDGKVLIGGVFYNYDLQGRRNVTRLGTDGSLDTSFNPGTGANGRVYAIVKQPDDKVLIGGQFTSYDGGGRNHIARLNPDGGLDTSFDPGTGTDSWVFTVALQPDGKVLIGGSFSSCDGTPRNRIARLNTDGSLDTSFDPGTGASGTVWSISVQPDGKILLGGEFTSYNGAGRSKLARLNADGSLDATFNIGSGASGQVYTTALQPDGRILIGGVFTSYAGVVRNRIARLNADGGVDTTFVPVTGANGFLDALLMQPDGRILIGGIFTSYNDTLRNRIARLEPNGSLDTSFDPGTGAGGQVRTIALQPDGMVLIGGLFTDYDGTGRGRIARLAPDGSLDTTFDPGTGANDDVRCIALQTDGRVLAGGTFTGFDGVGRNRLVRLNGDLSTGVASRPASRELVVWPNPATHAINLACPGQQARTLRLVDARGTVVLDAPVQGTLPLAGRAPGMYLLQVLDEQGRVFEWSRVVKQ